MKEDVRMKDIRNAVPTGTMPMVGAMQQMQASPKVMPAQAAPNVSPLQTAPKVSPAQTTPKVSPTQIAPNVMPAGIMPAQSMPNIMPAEMQNVSPMQMMPENMPVMAGPGGLMPAMMHQIPIICCPYLMNMQCPLLYGANVMGMNTMNDTMLPGVSPAAGNMMPYAGNAAPVMGAANNNMYGMPGMGTMPASMNNQYFPMGGMNY